MRRSMLVAVVWFVSCANGGDKDQGVNNGPAGSGGAGGVSITGGATGSTGTGGTPAMTDAGMGMDALPTPVEPTPILTSGTIGRFTLVNSENGDMKQLCKGSASNARWSPDKTAIVGDADVDIVIQTSACENRTVLSKNEDSFGNSKGASYMPRFVGDKIIFIQKVTSTMNVPNPAYIPGAPANTPQGQMTIEKTVIGSLELYSMEPKVSTTAPTKLTDFRRGGAGAEAFDIVGATVCYTKVQLEPKVDKGVYCADWPTLGNERRMTDKPGFSVSMSPDGGKVLFRTEANGKAIEVADTKVGGSQFLSGCTSGIDGAPVWSPDAKRIAYSCSGSADQGLYTANSDGTNIRKLSSESQTTFDWR